MYIKTSTAVMNKAIIVLLIRDDEYYFLYLFEVIDRFEKEAKA
jgi:hypothetical protein